MKKGQFQPIPNLLLCVGAQKSGTTWLYNRLAEHAQTRQAEFKELHYFTTCQGDGTLGATQKVNAMKRMLAQRPGRVLEFVRAQAMGAKLPQDVQRVFRPMNDNWYAGMFTGPGRYAMDFSPEYSQLDDAGHAHVKRVSDKRKVLFLMREPLDRALSAVRYFFKTRGKDITQATDAEILNAVRFPVIVKFSRYEETLATLERNYPAEDVMVLVYEEMMQNKAETLNKVCDWLEISRLDLPAKELEKRDNPTSAFTLPEFAIEELRAQLDPVRAAIEARFPEARAAWANVVPGQAA